MIQPAARLPDSDAAPKEIDVIDVGYYFGVLRDGWRTILLVTLGTVAVVALGVVLYRLFTPPVYEATATATIVRTFTNVQFDSRFTTSSESMTPNNNSVDSRRAALVALANSGAIAQKVIEQLGDALPLELQSTSKLLAVVETEMATTERIAQSDLININVEAPSPALAAAIANAWAEIYVQQVNSVYGQVPDDMLGSVAEQLVGARAAYAEAQASLEGFIATSQIDSLARELNTLTTTLDSLQQAKVDALDAYMGGLTKSYSDIIEGYIAAQTDAEMLAFTKEQEGDRDRVVTYLDAFNAAQIDTFAAEKENIYAELNSYYRQWQRTNALLTAARALQEQIDSGDPAAAGSELAMQVLNLQIINNSDPLSSLQFQVAAGGNEASAAPGGLRSQIDAAVSSLENQMAALRQNIDRLNQSIRSGNDFQELNAVVPPDSDLRGAIAAAYPSLFQTGVFSSAEFQSESNELLKAGQAQATKYLDLINLNELPTSSLPDAPMSAITAQLEEQARLVQERLANENARKLQIETARDLAWGSVEALGSKEAELQLARAAANSEVRLSSAAVPLDEPVQRISLVMSSILAAAVGVVLGIFVTFIREFIPDRHASSPDQAAITV